MPGAITCRNGFTTIFELATHENTVIDPDAGACAGACAGRLLERAGKPVAGTAGDSTGGTQSGIRSDGHQTAAASRRRTRCDLPSHYLQRWALPHPAR